MPRGRVVSMLLKVLVGERRLLFACWSLRVPRPRPLGGVKVFTVFTSDRIAEFKDARVTGGEGDAIV